MTYRNGYMINLPFLLLLRRRPLLFWQVTEIAFDTLAHRRGTAELKRAMGGKRERERTRRSIVITIAS